jgi:hypothetical protein
VLSPLGATACGPTTGYRARAAAERFPPFTPEEAALFDDTLAPALFASTPPTGRADDPKLVERTQRAEGVVPAQVATVSRDAPETGKPTFYLVVRPLGEPLAGSPPGEELTLPVGAASPSFPLLELGGLNPVGMRLILFFKRYNESGFVTVHWHAEPDTPEVRRAIEQARTLSEVGS